VAKVGETVQDGDLLFTVTRVERQPRVGSVNFGKDAQGMFLLVHVRVRNVGDSSQSFMGSAQKLRDEAGREFEASASAAIYLKDSNSLYEKINPGNSVEGVVVFDIPENTKEAAVELHDSMFSRGAKVALS
jgi:hypothetical protein